MDTCFEMALFYNDPLVLAMVKVKQHWADPECLLNGWHELYSDLHENFVDLHRLTETTECLIGDLYGEIPHEHLKTLATLSDLEFWAIGWETPLETARQHYIGRACGGHYTWLNIGEHHPLLAQYRRLSLSLDMEQHAAHTHTIQLDLICHILEGTNTHLRNA